MKFNFLTKYIYLTISLIASFWLISLWEVFFSVSNGIKISSIGTSITFKLLNDFWSGLIVGLFLLPFYLLINAFKKKYADVFIKVLFAFVIIIQFSLVKYSLTTLLNLGADLLGYSMDDIYITISSSESMSILYFLPFLLFIVLFFGIYYVLRKYITTKNVQGISIILILLFGSLKLVYSETSEEIYQNKIYYLVADVIKFQKEKNNANAYNFKNRNDYPYLEKFNTSKDVLAPFFNISEVKPNIVIIIVEGLGTEFMGGNSYSGFTPYLDSLITKSLYWENFVSTTGRTFGVVPSLLGSLPLGETGFLELPNTPSHISLISILKANDYTTSYYSGDQSSFDRKINFLEYSGIDDLIDENKFGIEYVKTKGNSGGFSWGYPDSEIFRKTLATLDGKKQPRLDIVMTLSNHEPFEFPLKENYLVKVDSMLNSNKSFRIPKEEIKTNNTIYASLLYTDNSIKDFMNSYQERPEYSNTIFIITGDHRLIPITQKDKLCRFHVPLLIYSPLLKNPERFKSISSHWDVTPSLLSFLMNNYKFNKPEETAWMSKGLDTAKHFRNIHQIPLMRYKGSINDFIYKDYLYSDGDLFKIKENFGTYKVNEEALLKEIKDSLKQFKKTNAYITQNNRIFPDSLNIYSTPRVEFSGEDLLVIKGLTKEMTFDQIFSLAREIAFNKDYKRSRLLCDYILNELPNHTDARTLKGRTFAWEGNYKNAEIELLNVIKRSPYFSDSYLALLDLYWWSDQDEKSIALVSKALNNNLSDSDITFKLAKAYKRMNEVKNASNLIDSILAIYPENNEYITFKQSLNQ